MFWWKKNHLNHCSLVTPYGDRDIFTIASGNGLLPHSTKLLPESMLTSRQWDCLAFGWGHFTETILDITYPKVLASPKAQWVNRYASLSTTRVNHFRDLVRLIIYRQCSQVIIHNSHASHSTYIYIYTCTYIRTYICINTYLIYIYMYIYIIKWLNTTVHMDKAKHGITNCTHKFRICISDEITCSDTVSACGKDWSDWVVYSHCY